MIVGLHGKKRVGKDTIYQIIQSIHPDATRIAFADRMKESLAALFGLYAKDIEYLKETNPSIEFVVKDKKHSLSWREIIQRYGTESHRDIFGQDFWIDTILPLKKDYYPNDRLVIVTDVRFKNEAERIIQLGGHVIQVTRPQLLNNDSHISEEPLPSYCISDNICNDGSFEDLKEKVIEVFGRLV